jgi:hypothetical protein
MKQIEIIIPHRLVDDAHEIIEGVNTGGIEFRSDSHRFTICHSYKALLD